MAVDSTLRTIYIASDHGGLELKADLIKFISGKRYKVEDIGPFSLDPDDDYPDFALKVCNKVSKENALGILVCRSGVGMCMAANKVPGIYAADCWNEDSAFFARKDEDSNVLCIGTRWIDREKAEGIVKTWLETPFEGGRHERRLNKIKEIEKTHLNAKGIDL